MAQSKNTGTKFSPAHARAAGAVGVELLNVALAYFYSDSMQGACPKGDASGVFIVILALSVISVALAFFAASVSRKDKPRAYALAAVWAALVLSAIFPLYMIASFTIDWCGYTF